MTAALRIPRAEFDQPAVVNSLDFELPDELVAHEPPEARGLTRDGVRLLVTDPADDSVRHVTARELPDFVHPGDVLVVNASATINAALDGWRSGLGGAPDEMIAVHLSSPVPDSDGDRLWVIELRRLTSDGTRPLRDAHVGERIRLRGGASATLLGAFGTPTEHALPNAGVRLWRAHVECDGGVMDYASEFGAPIRYGYVRERWPLSTYQTMFSFEPGSAEMPSAGRPFTANIVMRLQSKGIAIVPIILHTGVASLEAGEPPYPERFRVATCAADAVNRARANGGRVIAVGTTVVRALETAAAPDGTIRANQGWTDLVITPDRGVRAVDGLITGFHEPRASHLAMLEAVAGRRHLALAYRAALAGGYLWHEFGDLHLMIGNRESGIEADG